MVFVFVERVIHLALIATGVLLVLEEIVQLVKIDFLCLLLLNLNM